MTRKEKKTGGGGGEDRRVPRGRRAWGSRVDPIDFKLQHFPLKLQHFQFQINTSYGFWKKRPALFQL